MCFGEAAPLFASAVKGRGIPVEEVQTLEEAVTRAHEVARAGDAVLLSPAGTSFDAYPNFERRGDHFRKLVEAMANEARR